SSELKDKVAALKGAKIAISGPGSASDRNMRWLVDKYAGLNPDKDVDMLQVGGAPAMSAALDRNQVQAFMLSAPNCAQSKEGMVLSEPQDVPPFANYIHEVLYGTSEWVEENNSAATRVATAVAMGNNLLLNHTDVAIKMLQEQYSEVPPEVIEAAVKESIVPNVKANGTMNLSMWENTNKVLQEAGFIDEPLDTAEGTLWSNDYIRKDEAEVPA
ncbi:MAG: ABC transporter substrate-binding protein, partial [Micromonosporaceae bacterium]